MGVLARRIAAEIAISEFVARAVENPTTVLLNGVRPEPPSGQAKRVLIMQRLEAEKDTATAIQGFAASGLAQSGWELTIAGRGSQQRDLESLAAVSGIAEQTSFLGFVSDPAALRATGGIFLASAPEIGRASCRERVCCKV